MKQQIIPTEHEIATSSNDCIFRDNKRMRIILIFKNPSGNIYRCIIRIIQFHPVIGIKIIRRIVIYFVDYNGVGYEHIIVFPRSAMVERGKPIFRIGIIKFRIQ